jgi:hypothetical protein
VITVEEPPVAGEETVVLVTDGADRPQPGVTVRVLHRPELDGSQELAIGITDGLGRVRWTPEVAGVAELRANQDAMPVSIAWASVPAEPVSLLALLVLAGIASVVYGMTTGRRWTPGKTG